MRLRRPTSAMRAAESTKNITAGVAARSDIDVRPIISFVFEHGTKMKELLRERKLSKEEFCVRVGED
jgi:hypothetical protein